MMLCPIDDQPCAGSDCVEWDSYECQERRLAHMASVRVIEAELDGAALEADRAEQERMRGGHA
jgi:hypothetical protein